MKLGIVIIMILVLALTGVFASLASAGASQTAGATTSVKLPAGQLDYTGVSLWSRSHSAVH